MDHATIDNRSICLGFRNLRNDASGFVEIKLGDGDEWKGSNEDGLCVRSGTFADSAHGRVGPHHQGRSKTPSSFRFIRASNLTFTNTRTFTSNTPGTAFLRSKNFPTPIPKT